MSFANITVTNWLTIIAIIMAPLLAVQVQKWLDVIRERRTRKLAIFRSLMATRAARISPEHVQALNMIDLEFYGRKILWFRLQMPSEKRVTSKWREYLDQLNQGTNDEASQREWFIRSDDIYVGMLYEMAKSLGYNFDSVHLRRGIYSPKAHGQQEVAQAAIRDNLAVLLKGEKPLLVKIEGEKLPENPQ